jgi:hypothetical protein
MAPSNLNLNTTDVSSQHGFRTNRETSRGSNTTRVYIGHMACMGAVVYSCCVALSLVTILTELSNFLLNYF